MNTRTTLIRPVRSIAAPLVLSLLFLTGGTAAADERLEAKQLIERSQLTLQSFTCDEHMGGFRNLLADAKGVMIVPSLLKGAFVVGASGGSGVFMARDKVTGTWSDPAFYTMGGASFGLQAGGQASEVILLAMTDRGVTSFLGNSFKLGGEVGVAAGPVGIGASAGTANLSADILAFSRSKGLFGGISVEGAVVAVRNGINRSYYGDGVTPTDILVKHMVGTPEGAALADSLGSFGSGRMACGTMRGEPKG